MGLITFVTPGGEVTQTEYEDNFNLIYDEFNGEIDNANIKSTAGIVDTKLATISTPGKIASAALPTTIGGVVMADEQQVVDTRLRVQLSTSFNIPSGVTTAIVFDLDSTGLNFDSASIYNNTTGKITLTKAGYYLLGANFLMNGGVGNFVFAIKPNVGGNALSEVRHTGVDTSPIGLSTTTYYKGAVGDVLLCTVFQLTGGLVTFQNGSSFFLKYDGPIGS